MNRVLFKAAAIVNIAAAAFIYVACSGDDGKDGANGTSCNAVANTLIGGYDIVCGGVVSGNIKDGAQGIQGPPGTNVTGACAGTLVETGVAITCNGEFVGIVTNGLPGPQGPAGPAGPGGGTGPGGTGTCAVSPTVFENGDTGIEITCPTGETTAIILCPDGNGLYINTNGEAGYCDDNDNVSRQGGNLRCGGVKLNLSKEFCQRTLISDPTKFANVTLSATGVASAIAAAYPTTSNAGLIIESNPDNAALFAYNRGELYPNLVQSVKMPLCGAPIASATDPTGTLITTGSQVEPWHRTRVYHAGQQCARNLVIDTTTVYPVGDPLAGEIVPGGARDILPGAPYSTAWGIQNTGNCFVKTGPYNNYEVNLSQAGCAFYEAVTSPYTQCPTGMALGVDDVKCVARNVCVYHSTVDNTCLVKDAVATSGTRGQANVVSGTIDFDVGTGVNAASGIYKDGIGSYVTKSGGNKWSKACTTATRVSFYSVNDEYLVSRVGFMQIDAGMNGISIPPAGTATLPRVIGPICANTTPNAGGTATQPAVAFEEAFACLRGTLSVDDLENNGTAWDKPLYCKGSDLNVPVLGVCSSTSKGNCNAGNCSSTGGGTWTAAIGTQALSITDAVITSTDGTDCSSKATALATAINASATTKVQSATVSAATWVDGGSGNGTCALTITNATTVAISNDEVAGVISALTTTINGEAGISGAVVASSGSWTQTAAGHCD